MWAVQLLVRADLAADLRYSAVDLPNNSIIPQKFQAVNGNRLILNEIR